MVQIFKAPKKSPKKNTPLKRSLSIDTVDHHGVGVCRSHSPVVFVEQALPGEQCDVLIHEQKKHLWRGKTVKVVKASEARVKPFCPHFKECGGCQNQHADSEQLLTLKQTAVDELVKRQSGFDGLNWQAPLSSSSTGYRRKARLAIDSQHGKFELGFRAENSKRIIDISECQVLTPALQTLLPALKACMLRFNNKKSLGHISLFDADNQLQVCLRITADLNVKDKSLLTDFAQNNHCELLIERQKGQFESITGELKPASYVLNDGTELVVQPDDFVQVNREVNRAMVNQASDWLDIKPDDSVLDLFCGLGNFSLPLAKHAKAVIGVEGVDNMVQRAAQNAAHNQIENCRFVQADLFEVDWLKKLPHADFSKVLLDPARAGASDVVPSLIKLNPQRIVYVSCNPATFARDITQLKQGGYQLDKISLLDMFPHTVHTELMALFIRG
ncbi:23S rRNA (uracil(1939)-C(5))-methyltransferase RlmD [Neptunicella marina]|uniref:23S rRNA (uracil(1939)-C(5))-methyltransferase RlmD n=1 Tax=Neptunicella marina TaxID=2125989 RepID=A0A8J6IWV8_9ALTE|nr:23S rRNA (uracil(1939)-C(5))-methyltransferase RlmD [Neptunicella marina]MBC3766863.1 23S rRNA (uracil(1939)-C(5))-methyltransferase RlmD [Neptunicella marina]